MTSDQMRQRIFAMLKAALAVAPAVTYPVEWPNVRFQQPTDGPWIRVTLDTLDSNPIAIGDATTNRKRTPFVLQLQLFLQPDTGTKAAYDLHDRLSGEMDYQQVVTTVSGRKLDLTFVTWSIRTVGTRDGFEQFNLTIRGRADEDQA